MKTYYVYILSSNAGVLYTGVTSRIVGRTLEHKIGSNEGFSKKYKTKRLVYFESHCDPVAAISREKIIKTFSRKKKVVLIESLNPKWEDLAEDWFDNEEIEKITR